VLGVSAIGMVLSIVLARYRGWRQALLALVLFDAAVYVLLPGNPDAIRTPADILWTFRGLSFAGLAVFWCVLGVTFGWLLQRQEQRAVLRPRPSVA
jgi:predicted cobalt transporter CbtA